MSATISRGYWVVLLAVGSLYLFASLDFEPLWHDECFTEAMSDRGVMEIITLSENDNNSPFFYCALSLFRSAFGDSIYAMRSFSALAGLAIAGLGIGPIRRALGDRAGFLFVLLALTTPNLVSHCRELRAYGWAAYFVTGAAIYLYLFIWGEREPKSGSGLPAAAKTDWFALTALLAGCMYIHPYGLMAACFLSFIGLIDCAIFRRRHLPALIGATAIAAIAFLPWLNVMRVRAASVSGDFWIAPLDWMRFFGVLVYPYLRKFEFTALGIPAGLLTATFFSVGVVVAWRHRNSTGRAIAYAVFAYSATLAAAVFISLVKRPILDYRYIIPLFGLVLIVAAFGVSRFKPVIAAIIVVLMIGVSAPTIYYQYSVRTNGPMPKVKAFLDDEFQEGDTIIHFDEATAGLFHFYFPNKDQQVFAPPSSRFFSDLRVYEPIIERKETFDELGVGSRRIWVVELDRSLNPADLESLPGPVLVKRFSERASFYALSLKLIELPMPAN